MPRLPLTQATLQQWDRLCQALGIAMPVSDYFNELVQRYSESHRAYHTLLHIDECLAHFSAIRHLTDQPHIVEVAIWFHDVIYDPKRSDNEAASAVVATTFCQEYGMALATITQIGQLILFTKHDRSPPAGDGALLVDIDLAVFGATATRFDEYEQQIRDEYAWVPWSTFCQKRVELLQQFLARPSIYQTAYFQERFESTARRNLEHSVQQLRLGT